MVEKINKILKISAVGEVFRLRNAGKELHEWLEKIWKLHPVNLCVNWVKICNIIFFVYIFKCL